MALSGLKTNTEFLPSIRFNAREGVFSRVDRSLDAEGNTGLCRDQPPVWIARLKNRLERTQRFFFAAQRDQGFRVGQMRCSVVFF